MAIKSATIKRVTVFLVFLGAGILALVESENPAVFAACYLVWIVCSVVIQSRLVLSTLIGTFLGWILSLAAMRASEGIEKPIVGAVCGFIVGLMTDIAKHDTPLENAGGSSCGEPDKSREGERVGDEERVGNNESEH